MSAKRKFYLSVTVGATAILCLTGMVWAQATTSPESFDPDRPT